MIFVGAETVFRLLGWFWIFLMLPQCVLGFALLTSQRYWPAYQVPYPYRTSLTFLSQKVQLCTDKTYWFLIFPNRIFETALRVFKTYVAASEVNISESKNFLDYK